MMLRESKGNMYSFVTHTWNPIKGKCFHDCEYCYMKRFPLKELRLDEKDLHTDLGTGRFIFVGSSTDMWAKTVPIEWINKVLYQCQEYPGNTYLFQSKNPERFPFYPDIDIVYGTTIETNRWYSCMGNKAPLPMVRAERMALLGHRGRRIMVTIEPIIDFDLLEMVDLIRITRPEWVNIGADSKNHGLPEPEAEKIMELIKQLGEFTNVNNKNNLSRLIKL